MRIASPRNTAIATSFNPCPDPFAPLSSVFRSLFRLSVRFPLPPSAFLKNFFSLSFGFPLGFPRPFGLYQDFLRPFGFLQNSLRQGAPQKDRSRALCPCIQKSARNACAFLYALLSLPRPPHGSAAATVPCKKLVCPPARNGQGRPPLYPHPRLDGAISNGSAALRFIGRKTNRSSAPALRFIGRTGALTFRKGLYCSKRSPNTNVNRATVSTIPMTIK